MTQTDSSVITAEVNNYYDKALLHIAKPYLPHTKWGQKRTIPANSGTKVIKFRRYSLLTAATTALTEGVTPAGVPLAVTDLTATASQYGNFVYVTDVLAFTSQDAVLNEATMILGQNAGNTLDQICRDIIVAGTNVLYGGSATSRITVGASDLITTTLISKAVRTLNGNNAMKFTKMVGASDGVGTSPLNAAYIGICHPRVAYTLKGLTGFTTVEKYGHQTDMLENEIGYYDEVRFVQSTNAKVFTGGGSGGIDVYGTLILAQFAYGTIDLGGEGMMKTIIKPFGSAGTADPLEQQATVAWKAMFTAVILDDNFMVRIETAVSA